MMLSRMDTKNYEEGLGLARQLKETVAIALGMVMIKRARREGVSAFQYTKSFQEKYIQEHQEQLNPILRQRFLASCQDEVLEKLRKAIPLPCEPLKCYQNSETHVTESVEDSGVDWFDEWCAETDTRQKPQHSTQTKPPLPQRPFKAEDSAMRNVQFVESMLRLDESTEQSELIATSELHSLLYNEGEFRHNSQNSNLHGDYQMFTEKRLTEDSGFNESEFTERSTSSHGVRFISGNVIKDNMRSSNSEHLMNQSAKLIVDYVQKEVKQKTLEMFCNWKQSLVEHACNILNRFAVKNEDCNEMLLDLSLDLMEDIWHDRNTSQHQVWEVKCYTIINILPAVENCYETLQYISEKCAIFRKELIKSSKECAMMAEKLNLLLNLYCSVCEKIQLLNRQKKEDEVDKKQKREDSEVTLLWREKWGKKMEEEEDEHETDEMLGKQIESFEVLVISMSHRYPLLVMLLFEAIDAARSLSSQRTSSMDEDLL